MPKLTSRLAGNFSFYGVTGRSFALPSGSFDGVVKVTAYTSQVIRTIVPAGSWVTAIDFSDAFHHLPIHPHYRRILAFHVGGGGISNIVPVCLG